MTPENTKKLHKIWGIVTAVLIGIVAVCLVAGCLNIYSQGDRPFTAENVTQTLQNIAIPGILCLVFVVGGIILHWIFPVQESRTKAIRDKNGVPKATDEHKLWFVRGAVVAVAVALIVLGIINNGYADVLGKAIRICQECIGIG